MLNPFIRWLLSLVLAVTTRAACEHVYVVVYHDLGYASSNRAGDSATGFLIDLYHEMEKRTGCRFVLRSVPIARVKKTSASDPPAIVGPTSSDRLQGDRPATFFPLMQDSIEFLVNDKQAFDPVRDAVPPAGVHIGILRGASYGPWVDRYLQALPPDRVDIVDSLDSIYKMLEADHIQATFGNAYVYAWHLAQMPGNAHVRVIPIEPAGKVMVGVRLNRKIIAPADFEMLGSALEAIRDEGLFRKMVARYLGDSAAHARTDAALHGKRIEFPDNQ